MAWGCDVMTQKTPTNNSEAESVLVPKVQALMESLDQVKRYKKLSSSIIDLILIIVASVAVAAAIDLAGYFYLLLYSNIGSTASGFFYVTPPEFFIGIVVVIAGVLIGVLLVDRKVKNVSTEEWKKSLEEKNVPAALNILSSLDWGSAFKDIQYSKLGFLLYGFLKVVGYWLFFSFLLLLFDGFFVLDYLHVSINWEALSILSLVIALAVSWGDLKSRFDRSWSLDTLLWELRWFDSEFRRAESEFAKEA